MSLDANALVQQLLAAREGGGSVASLLAEHEDPTLRAMAQMMAAREAEEQIEAAEEALERENAEALVAAEQEPSHDEQRLLDRMERLRAEIRRLRRINDVLAAALGACPVCWGEEPDCEVCDGEGAPGWDVPERRLFLRLVRPAMTRVQPKTTTSRTANRRVGHLTEVAPMPERTSSPERREP